jgi:hypothetical protein
MAVFYSLDQDFYRIFFLCILSVLVTGLGSATTSNLGEAGVQSGISGSNWYSVDLGASYGDTPYIFATTQTVHGSEHPSGAHVRSVSESGFETQHCEYEASDGCDGHAEETNGWFSVDPSVIEDADGMDAGTVVTSSASGGYKVSFDNSIENTPLLFTNIQTENGSDDSLNTQARDITPDNATVEFCEQNGGDGCDSSHDDETVAWMAIDPQIIKERDGFEYGTFDAGDSNWKSVSFSQSFSEAPVVIADVQTETGPQEALYPEVNNVGTGGADIRYCESGGGDGCDTHNVETVAWLALEPGNVSINATGATLCDSRGPNNECISSSTHEIDSETYSISSVFQTEESAVFKALNEKATINVDNSSIISGLWKGSFNISSSESPIIRKGASFRPRGGRIVVS